MEHTAAQVGRSAIYGGGPFYTGGQPVMDTLRSSGFNTVILWSLHVYDNGDLYYNGDPFVSDGVFVGNLGWLQQIATLKQAPTSVNRIEVSVGSGGVDDWGNIRNLINSQGTGPDSILYKNFKVLQEATGADAINDDDESCYDVATTVRFAQMCPTIGYGNFTFAPYTNMGFWQQVKQPLGNLVDRVYLQCYSGGTGNDPGQWERGLQMNVDPGLWCRNGDGCAEGDSPAQVSKTMRDWYFSDGIPGGFIWLFDDIQKCEPGTGYTPADYAGAVNKATSSAGTPASAGTR